MKPLRKVHAGSPLRTNASLNRDAAVKAFKAGLTIQQIVAEWPEVFKLVMEGDRPTLGQKYDYELADGSGRFETRRMITAESVKLAIARYGKGQAS